MRVAIAGAGVTGLVAGHRLALAGHEVDVYERWPGLGGQAATLEVAGGARLERYYHHLFTSDRDIADLYSDLGMPDAIDWLPSSVAMFADGRQWPFTTPLDLLRFSPLSVRARVRMGLAVLLLQRRPRPLEHYEAMTAREWIEKAMGREVWQRVWGPLLRGKFGDRAGDISMAWLFSKLTVRRQIRGREARQELLGYPRGSWEPLYERLRDEIEGRGGRVLIDRPVRAIRPAEEGLEMEWGAEGSHRLGHDPARFTAAGSARYDSVLATVPSGVFERMLAPELAGRLAPGYRERLRAAEYHTALCLLLELDRPFSPYYWTNVADRDLPFLGLIEQTNLVPPETYGGARYLYVANYLAPGDPLLELDAEELLGEYEAGLRRVSPGFSREWVSGMRLFTEPAAQPIVTAGYRERIPPMQTGVPGLLLANTTQIYPEDRGTNYSVRLGEQAARTLMGKPVDGYGAGSHGEAA